MKINIDELTLEEIKEVVDRLRSMKLETVMRRAGPSVVLQTEQGPMLVPKAEALDIFGVPEMMF